MNAKIAWACALLISAPAFAQTPAPATPTGAGQPAVPEKVAPGAMAPSPSGTTMTAHLSAEDQKFMTTIASAGLAEVKAAQLAQQKSKSDKVKDFAQRMITDHTSNNQQLASLAQQKGFTIPTAPVGKDQKQLDHLDKLNGSKFDRAYMKDQVHDHEQVLKLLQSEVQDGQDADVKAFAQQTIPVIQQHLDLAKSGGTTS